jgi:hypothetical protein
VPAGVVRDAMAHGDVAVDMFSRVAVDEPYDVSVRILHSRLLENSRWVGPPDVTGR